MIEWLKALDRTIILSINGWNSPALDEFFFFISSRTPWILLYALIIFFVAHIYGWKKLLPFLAVVALAVIIADVSSVYLFKETVQRYRPSHNLQIGQLLHFYRNPDGSFYKGGSYGFVSSHATNFAVLTTFVGLTLRKSLPNLIWWMIAITLLVCYSRMYLGVHYFSDIAGGLIWGSLIGVFTWWFAGRKLLSE